MTQTLVSIPMFVPFTAISLATVDPIASMNIPSSGRAFTMTTLMSLPFSSFTLDLHGLGSSMPNKPSGHRDSFGSVFLESQVYT